MPGKNNVLNCYNLTAAAYAERFFNEFEHKHFDRIFLEAFAKENKSKGPMLDLGCGPGQTTTLMHSFGVHDILGTDLSPVMVAKAAGLNPGIKFETADMLALQFPETQFASAIAFYAIVHFNEAELTTALNEISRVLKPGGQFLFSFHVGSQVVHHDTFLDEQVNIDFYFWEISKVTQIAADCGFGIVDVIERKPYPDVEYPSNRAYIWVRKG